MRIYSWNVTVQVYYKWANHLLRTPTVYQSKANRLLGTPTVYQSKTNHYFLLLRCSSRKKIICSGLQRYISRKPIVCFVLIRCRSQKQIICSDSSGVGVENQSFARVLLRNMSYMVYWHKKTLPQTLMLFCGNRFYFYVRYRRTPSLTVKHHHPTMYYRYFAVSPDN